MMVTIAFTALLLFGLGVIVILISFNIFLIKRRNTLLDEKNHYRQCFDNSTTEITRLSYQLIKERRNNNLNKNDNDDISLNIDDILDRISKIGYDNLSFIEKNFLNNQK